MNSNALYSRLINRSDLVAFALFAAIFIGQTSLFFESQDKNQFVNELSYRAAAPSSQADILRPDHSVSQAQHRSVNLFLRTLDFSFEAVNPLHSYFLRIAAFTSRLAGRVNHAVLQVFRI